MPSHNRITVNFKEQLYQIVEAEKERRGMSLSAVVAELIVDGIMARKDKGITKPNDLERNYGDLNQPPYAEQFPINHVPLSTEIFDTTPPHNGRVEFFFPVSSVLMINNREEMIDLVSNKVVREKIINDLTVKVKKFSNTSAMHVVIVTRATVSFERHIDRYSFIVKVVYDYLHTLLQPEGDDAQKYLLDVLKIRYMRYRDVLIRADKYPHYSTVLYINEAKTRASGGYFVGVLRKPIKFEKIKKRAFKKNGAHFALFINRNVIKIRRRSFIKIKQWPVKPRYFDKFKP